MTTTRKMTLLFLAILIALPLAAANPRRRASGMSPAATTEVEVTGTIKDSVTGQPVVGVVVAVGRLRVNSDTAGKFKITLPKGVTTVLTASRSGYESVTFSVAPAGALTHDLKMKPTATVAVVLTNGTRYDLDGETAQFAYLVPLSGYAKSDTANFCRPDGSAWTPAKSELKKITGPGIKTNVAACCPNSPVVVVNVEAKDGTTSQVSMKDSCIGYEVDFVGRNHITAEFQYFRWTDIAQVVFP